MSASQKFQGASSQTAQTREFSYVHPARLALKILYTLTQIDLDIVKKACKDLNSKAYFIVISIINLAHSS